MDSIETGIQRDLRMVKQGSYSQVSGDVLDHVLYDNVLFAATTARASTTFFTTPIGGAYGTVTKGKQETNMTDPGKLPAGQGFVIKEIGWALPQLSVAADNDAATVMQAIINILGFSVFEIRIAGREFDLQFPGTMLLPALPSRTNSVYVAATAFPAFSGEWLSSGWFKLAAPIIIGELVSFSIVHLVGSAIAANTTILNTSSNTLSVKGTPLQLKLRGTLVRSK